MSARIFDYDMTDRDTIILQDGERLYKIITGNSMDALYIISTPEAAEAEERTLEVAARHERIGEMRMARAIYERLA